MSTTSLTLTADERALLEDVLDYWLQGYPEAETQVFDDENLQPDELLLVVTGLGYDKSLAMGLLERVRNV